MRRLPELASTLGIAIAVFGTIQLGFDGVNWVVYGKFVGVDFKEANYQRALRAIDSVRSGGTKDYVSITHAAMKRVDAVSPAFASLAPYFNGPGKGWESITCSLYSNVCGEIGSGWFVWALRDAAAMTGHYTSPAEASAFYGRIADEITEACRRGELDCKLQLIAEMPPVNWADVISRMPSLYALAFNDLLLIRPLLQFNPSSGADAQLGTALRFLNYPLYTRPLNIASAATYSLSGWYYKSGHKWLWATVKTPNGSLAVMQFERNSSADIQAAFKDPEASYQRFVISTRCNDECTIEFHSQDDEVVQKKLSDFRHGPIEFVLGKGRVHVDNTGVNADPVYSEELIEVISEYVRQAVLYNYAYVFLPVLVLGTVCFLVTTLSYWRCVMTNVSYILALCSWTLVAVRISIIVLIAATSFPALNPSYLWPSQLLLVSGALFSCAAWLQLWERSSTRSRAAVPDPMRASKQ